MVTVEEQLQFFFFKVSKCPGMSQEVAPSFVLLRPYLLLAAESTMYTEPGDVGQEHLCLPWVTSSVLISLVSPFPTVPSHPSQSLGR